MGLRKAAVIHEPPSLKPFVCTLTGKIIPTKKHRAGGGEERQAINYVHTAKSQPETYE